MTGVQTCALPISSFAGAVAAAPALPARVAASLLSQARAAFTSGMHVTATTSAVLLVGVAVMAVVLLRHVGPAGAAAPAAVTDQAAAAGDTVATTDTTAAGVTAQEGAPTAVR